MPFAPPLLAADEPAAVGTDRAAGRSPFVLACDHAGNAVPRSLGCLGLGLDDRLRHIAWDIGALGVARRLAAVLGAPLVWQTYSRLVIDCNRGPWAPDFIPTISEHTMVPGNLGLSVNDRAARIEAIFAPYHQRLASILDGRHAAGQPAVLVAIHSFTPIFKGVPRPWHVGVLSNRDRRLAAPMLADLRRDGRLCVGDNEPYAVSDATDYTIPVHGETRGIPHVEIEIRQDLIGDEAGQAAWAERLAGCLKRGFASLVGTSAA
jgi:Predicted N-formylglutamate amidohydrolase